MLEKNISYRNILICADLLTILFFTVFGMVIGEWYSGIVVAGIIVVAIIIVAILRKITLIIK